MVVGLASLNCHLFVDGDAEAVKVRMTGDFGFGGNGRTFTPPGFRCCRF
jgi:hypothetical protein